MPEFASAAGAEDSAALVKRIAAGDKPALEELYRRHSSVCLALARKILSRLGDAEDAVQEAFVEIWRKAHRFDPRRGSAEAWTYGIVRNRCIDRLRRHALRTRVATDADKDEREPASVSPLEEAQRREERLAIVSAVATIPKEQRDSLELAYFEGLSHAEIAKRSGEPLGTIKTRFRSAVLKLGRALGRPARSGDA